jgi:hypothetical protein
VVASGEAAAGTKPGTFVVSVPASMTMKLAPGLYELSLLAYSDAIAQVASRSVDVNVKK